MKRKDFIAAGVLASIPFPAIAKSISGSRKLYEIVIPPYLRAGDAIGITSAAGTIKLEECTDAIKMMESWGYKVRIGNSIGKKDFTFGGTDDERAADLQQMLDDDSISAIMCARGGYGLVRIIDKLNFQRFIRRPKWLIGFSDATVLHCHVNTNFHIATLHSKMCNSFPATGAADELQTAAIESIRKCLAGDKMVYSVVADADNKVGSSSAQLIGGNLKTIESLFATPSEIDTKNKILFLEDTGEYLYSIDRMFCHLGRSGKLKELKGLIIGGFKIKPDDEGGEFGRTVNQIVLEKTSAYNYPVCFGFPVGHQKDNFALKCGVVHELDVTATSVTLRSTS